LEGGRRIAGPGRTKQEGYRIGKQRLAPLSRTPERRRAFLTAPAERPYNSNFSQEFLMYAVVKTGGKQYKVAPGEKLKVEQLPADVGAEVVLDQVLLVGEGDSVRLGQPVVAGASVKATVVAHGRHAKVKIFKMRRRKHYQKHQGHRQNYTEIKIETIVA
jgi:large subunit ribosomal protein L21